MRDSGRPWEPREMRLVEDYCKEFYSGAKVLYRVRLGSAPLVVKSKFGKDRGERWFQPFKPWADAVIILPDQVILLEAKLRATTAALGQVLMYRDVFFDTPEFVQYKGRELITRVISPWWDEKIANLLHQYKIETEYYEPAWVEDYVEYMKHYWAKTYKAEHFGKGVR